MNTAPHRPVGHSASQVPVAPQTNWRNAHRSTPSGGRGAQRAGGGMPWWGWLVVAGGVAVIVLVAVLVVVMVVNVGSTLTEAVAKKEQESQTFAEMDHATMQMAQQEDDSLYSDAPTNAISQQQDRYLTTMEQKAATLSGTDGKIARASVAMMRSIQPDRAAYLAAIHAVENVGVDSYHFNSKTDLEESVAGLKQLRAAGDRLSAAFQALPDRFIKELEAQGVSPDEIEAARDEFIDKAEVEMLVEILAADNKVYSAISKLTSLLKREWGNWTPYDDGIAFESVILERQFERAVADLDAAMLNRMQVAARLFSSSR